MSDTLKRVELPSGRWWEVEGRPRWRHLRELAARRGLGSPMQASYSDLADVALVLLTTAWSFEEPVCPASVRNREPDDVAAVLTEVAEAMEHLVRTRRDKGALAMKLFAGLMQGRVPEAFEEVDLMSRTGWTWEQLQETPADVVELTSVYLSVVEAIETGGSVGAEVGGDGGV